MMADDSSRLPPIIGLGGTTSSSRRLITPTPYVWTDPSTAPMRQWLYKPGYIRKYISAVFARTKLGKSSLVLVEAMAMATNRALLGVQPSSRLRVWYWNGEDP